MPRPKKDSKPFSIRMNQTVYEELCRYCEETGVPKTTMIEKAVSNFVRDYDRQKRILETFDK